MVIAHDVNPIELVVWLPALCRKMGIPYCIMKGKVRWYTCSTNWTGNQRLLTLSDILASISVTRLDAVLPSQDNKQTTSMCRRRELEDASYGSRIIGVRITQAKYFEPPHTALHQNHNDAAVFIP